MDSGVASMICMGMADSFRGPKYRPERDEAVRLLREDGLSDPQISKKTGINVRTVIRARKRLGLPPLPRYARPLRLPLVEPNPKLRCGELRGPASQSPCELRRGHENDSALPDEHMGRNPRGSNWTVWTKPSPKWLRRKPDGEFKWKATRSSSRRPSRATLSTR